MKHKVKTFAAGFIAVVASVMLAGCQSLQPPKHEIGQTFRGAFVFSSDNTAVPLPNEGAWILVDFDQFHALNSGRIKQAVLAQMDNGKLARFVWASLQSLNTIGGWEDRKHCFGEADDEWVLHSDTDSYFRGDSLGEYDCWKMEVWSMQKWKDTPWNRTWNQSLDYYSNRNISTGRSAAVAYFLQSAPRKFLRVAYGFNPQVDGDLTDSQNTNWKKHRYYQDKNRNEYIEEKKEWGEKWRHKVANGITGKLPVQPARSASDRISELQQLLDSGAITSEFYDKKKQEILDGL
ncbi:MAG: SHOCT domain-containing protein [bacterium]